MEDLIQQIEHFRSRIGMYIHSVDVANTQSFLAGFTMAVHVFGIRPDHNIHWNVQESRGWKQSPDGPVPQMRGKGMSDRQIIDELIDIEIEILRRSSAA